MINNTSSLGLKSSVGNPNKISVDVFFDTEDITSLRWLNELHEKIRPYQNIVTVNVHDCRNSLESKQLHINTDTILINEKKINCCHLEQILIEMAKKFVVN
ncbi:MAG: hypothetical protein ACW981_10120 [Candidatus Hodarchaeales archaeon]|jgi:hypothetical protein